MFSSLSLVKIVLPFYICIEMLGCLIFMPIFDGVFLNNSIAVSHQVCMYLISLNMVSRMRTDRLNEKFRSKFPEG